MSMSDDSACFKGGSWNGFGVVVELFWSGLVCTFSAFTVGLGFIGFGV